MSILFSRWQFSGWVAIASVIVPLTLLASACADGGGYVDGGVGVDYYEPYGAEYGGWGSGYYVGPYRGGGHADGGHPGGGAAHAFHGAPAGHSAPSLPSGGHGGGHAGGGRR